MTVLLVSGALVDAPLPRLTVQPDESNGLQMLSQILIDKTMTIMRTKIGETFGRLDGDAMVEIERRLAVSFGIAKERSWRLARGLAGTISRGTVRR